MLAVHYEDVAERHRLAKDQGSMDLRTMFNDIMIRLSGTYEMTKEQQVCGDLSILGLNQS